MNLGHLLIDKILIKNLLRLARKMSQLLRLLPSLLNLSLVLNIHDGQLTTSCNSSFRALDTLSWLL